jgi:hypothetical protein
MVVRFLCLSMLQSEQACSVLIMRFEINARHAMQVIFHLQSCRPAILPPLWLLFHNEPPHGPRPLEQQQQQQRSVSQPPGNRSSSSSSSNRRQAQQSLMRSGAPYTLLQVCQQQRARYQGYYNTSSGSSSSGGSSSWQQGLAELLAGFFVRFREVMVQWLEQGRHRCGMHRRECYFRATIS